jgi:hypothetical protein
MYLLPIDPCTGQSPTGVPLKITDVVNCCGDTFPAWSPVPAPNGEELIAYVQGSLFPAHVFVINPGWNGDLESPAVDPGPPIQLAPLNPGEDFQLGPTWSPTANRLAVASHADDYADIEVFALDADLAILPLGQRVTRTVLTRVVGFIVHMAWSRLDDTGMLAASYARDVFLVSVDSPGGTPINLTNTASALERGVDWSPDDKRMVVGRSDTIFRRNGKPLPGTVARTIVFDVDVGTPSLSDPIQIGADRDRPQWRRFDPVCP